MTEESSEEELAYCMDCKKNVPISKAISLLKTGFYLHKFPMSMNCTECKHETDYED